MKRFDERGVFYGQGSDDGLHHGVPLLPPDDAGPTAVGERTGTLAVSLYRANAAYWQFPLHLQLNELAGALRLSRSSVQRARAELAEQGYLLYEQEPGNRSVKYYLISNVRPHMLMTPEEMLAGSKSYQGFTVAETQVREEDTHVCNESCTRAVSGN